MKTKNVVAAIIRDSKGRIFCTQRGYGEWKDWWKFPGGKSNILKDLKGFVERFKPAPDENGEILNNSLYMKVIKKLEEMDGKLSGYYTNFF